MMAINPGFRPKVSVAQVDKLRVVVKRSMEELLQMVTACETSPAAAVDPATKRKVQYTSMPPKTTNEDVMTYCVSTTLHASLGDIQDIMLSRISRTDESHAFAKATETHVKGSKLLMKIDDTLTLNWAMIHSMSAVMRDRDFVYVQSRQQREWYGRPTWISCTHSVSIDGVAPLDTSVYDVVRGGVYSSGYVFMEQPDQSVHAIYVLQVDFKGASPHWMAQSTLQNWGNALERMATFFESRQLGRISDFILSDMQVKSFRAGMHCRVCAKDPTTIGILSKPDNCRICGEVVCGRCVQKKEVMLKHGPVRLSMCHACLESSLTPECFSPTLRRVRNNMRPSSSSSADDWPDDGTPRRQRIQEPADTILLPGAVYRHRNSSLSRSRRSLSLRDDSARLPPPRITKELPDNLDVLDKIF
ncbi:Aste57867_9239 [Aphanomyces stellatus]|uniref:Aste57867_9239 protein n=1 Tax=Aphanomyces stellatus TaxID=120398 RepID=A0A485KMD7_9STRA|nr:hypothetical protein As57867_009203 [Aphanomyces stellatus]VFT86122.1 Aste57867_9239 [Aphanomyces stellatus]